MLKSEILQILSDEGYQIDDMKDMAYDDEFDGQAAIKSVIHFSLPSPQGVHSYAMQSAYTTSGYTRWEFVKKSVIYDRFLFDIERIEDFQAIIKMDKKLGNYVVSSTAPAVTVLFNFPGEPLTDQADLISSLAPSMVSVYGPRSPIFQGGNRPKSVFFWGDFVDKTPSEILEVLKPGSAPHTSRVSGREHFFTALSANITHHVRDLWILSNMPLSPTNVAWGGGSGLRWNKRAKYRNVHGENALSHKFTYPSMSAFQAQIYLSSLPG